MNNEFNLEEAVKKAKAYKPEPKKRGPAFNPDSLHGRANQIFQKAECSLKSGAIKDALGISKNHAASIVTHLFQRGEIKRVGIGQYVHKDHFKGEEQ